MPLVVRRCPRCGHEEAGYGWTSVAEDAEAGAHGREWTCPGCYWTEPAPVVNGPREVMREYDHGSIRPDDWLQ